MCLTDKKKGGIDMESSERKMHMMRVEAVTRLRTACGKDHVNGMAYTCRHERVTCPECLREIEAEAEFPEYAEISKALRAAEIANVMIAQLALELKEASAALRELAEARKRREF